MRLFNRLYALCALALCSILISSLFLASQHYYRRVVPAHSPAVEFDAANTFDRRLVVFGDSWSDNNAGEIQGSVWTDWLCSLYECHHENLAQTAKSLRGNYIGSVVDNSELSGPMLNLYKSPLADFKTQMSQWTAAETLVLQSLSDDETSSRLNNTIVVVSFGVWDLWNMVGKSYEESTGLIDHSIQVIMDQLNVLSHLWGANDLNVILTLTPDVTFLPAFKPTADERVSRHKDTVKTTEYWNSKLREAAEQWDQGEIYLFDTNAFLADQIRDWQLFAAGVEEANGLGRNQDPGWENVEDACVQSGQQWVMVSKEKQCSKPDRYLFWNEMHLGPSAHRLMGTEVFHGIEEKWLK
ncbi:uncharacterized protein ACLA_049980 [Aspergillus clavatus NRRL 1]|uniref:Uncharacterized protein n=1 Tax=Aspergillus clavatus (strain ATCC 1007 / CBS 513.65 / DSM 816 / NCTC 3887 / NRRL 1 / QM 1276 / 107) TaxID=344612 RepID=A1CI21_ASPCL|nr:uncharacterized protein ACLA_049980 [Aspergillus clavatus NRRL 1]EAW10526.1 conserved hypothetical protein [Aspergillus clavatus NRRL 1]